MYHIKNDKRMQKSAELICDGLSRTLGQKPYREIGVTDVCAAAGVARTTFYRLFDTVDDVLMLQFDCLFETGIKGRRKGSVETIPPARALLEVAVANPSTTKAIVASERADLFEHATERFEGYLGESMGLDLNERQTAFLRSMLTQAAFVTLEDWIARGCKDTAAELHAFLGEQVRLLGENI